MMSYPAKKFKTNISKSKTVSVPISRIDFESDGDDESMSGEKVNGYSSDDTSSLPDFPPEGSIQAGIGLDRPTASQAAPVPGPVSSRLKIGDGDRTGNSFTRGFISFPLQPSFLDDNWLARHYPNVNERSVAKFVRDLQLGVRNHRERLQLTGCLQISDSPDNEPLVFGPNVKLSKSLHAAIKFLELMKEQVVTCFEVDMAPNTVCFEEEVCPWTQWPYNKFDTYLSRLCCRFRATSQTMERHLVETADYCIGLHNSFSAREPLFQTAGGILVQRKEMYSMEHGVPIHPSVISAWAAVCIDLWKQLGHSARMCLDVVAKSRDSDNSTNVLNHWLTWHKNFELPLNKAELVFIPCLLGNDYTLLVLNYNKKVIQCIDTVYKSDRGEVDDFARLTVTNYCKFLDMVKAGRHERVDEFTYQVLYPKWSTSISDPESGVSVMHLLSHHDHPQSKNISFKLEEEHVRVYKRINICSSMVQSRINNQRFRVLANVQHFVDQKNGRTLCPSKDVDIFRSNY